MISKVTDILSSVRFWQLVVAVAVYYFGDAVLSPDLVSAITTVLAGSVAIGTVDKVGKK